MQCLHLTSGAWPQRMSIMIVDEQIAIMSDALHKAIMAAVATCNNVQLQRHDWVLKQLRLTDTTRAHARPVPFFGSHVMWPDPKAFDRKLLGRSKSVKLYMVVGLSVSNVPCNQLPDLNRHRRQTQNSERTRVLASPKFLPTDSDLCSSRIRRTDRNRRKNVTMYIIYIYIICIC